MGAIGFERRSCAACSDHRPSRWYSFGSAEGVGEQFVKLNIAVTSPIIRDVLVRPAASLSRSRVYPRWRWRPR